MTFDYLGILLPLIIILGLILLLSWLLKRFYKPITEKNALLKIQASISVGPHERVVLIKVAEQWLVLGVTPNQVNTLLALPADAISEADFNTSNQQSELAKYWWQYHKNISL